LNYTREGMAFYPRVAETATTHDSLIGYGGSCP